MASRALTLFTINMSHYSEKIRWLLDYEEIPYQEIALTPALHTVPMWFKGRRAQTTVPLLQSGKICIQDSPRIVDWLAVHCSPLDSMPSGKQQEILAVQQRFDAIGKPIARYLYLPGFAHDALIRTLWTQFAKPWERRFIALAYPLIKPAFRIKLRINSRAVKQAEQLIDAEIRWLEQRLQQLEPGIKQKEPQETEQPIKGQKEEQGRRSKTCRYLVGDAFSFADIAAASILAPLACPPEHPIYGEEEFREKMAGPAQQWADSAALQWVRDIYAEHRGTVWTRIPVL
ncbi:MAG: glutathione S-transferase N-terminal domain-containing protein [Saccharospirillaceae bacterium]|nr:glutathione S-transferase N-terminal domain-containing protein [Saccharospirillaceae bacterium]MCD8532549.1 glutathione S-transferase N-terminal domain-containing protein [Saccharospirillaceae bacterium]